MNQNTQYIHFCCFQGLVSAYFGNFLWCLWYPITIIQSLYIFWYSSLKWSSKEIGRYWWKSSSAVTETLKFSIFYLQRMTTKERNSLEHCHPELVKRSWRNIALWIPEDHKCGLASWHWTSCCWALVFLWFNCGDCSSYSFLE